MAVTWWRLLMAALVADTGGGGGGSNCEVSPAQVEKAAGALCPLRLYLPNLVMCRDLKMIQSRVTFATEVSQQRSGQFNCMESILFKNDINAMQ